MQILSLDIGTRRTGVAIANSRDGVAVALETLTHESAEELVEHVVHLVRERKVDRVVVGHPLLLSGASGSQAAFVEHVVDDLKAHEISAELLDERFTTPSLPHPDTDQAAACQLLLTYLERRGNIE